MPREAGGFRGYMYDFTPPASLGKYRYANVTCGFSEAPKQRQAFVRLEIALFSHKAVACAAHARAPYPASCATGLSASVRSGSAPETPRRATSYAPESA